MYDVSVQKQFTMENDHRVVRATIRWNHKTKERRFIRPTAKILENEQHQSQQELQNSLTPANKK